MGIELIAKSLLVESEKEATSLISNAQTEAEKIISDAKKIEKKMLDDGLNEVSQKLSDHRKERIAWANLEKKKIISEAKEEAICIILENFKENLIDLKKKPQYGLFLKKKLNESLEEISDPQAIVHIAKGDKKYFANIGKNLKIVEDLEFCGGLIVSNKEETIQVNNTIESIYEMKKSKIRKEIYNSLFASKGEE